ncbi:MAG TPA: GAF domain-containing protein [Crinalium sp.]
MQAYPFEQLRQCCRDEAAFEQMLHLLAMDTVEFPTDRQKALFRVIAKIRESLDLDTIFKATATEVRQLLNADRVGVFRFHPNSGYSDGEFVSEDVLPQYPRALDAQIHDHCFGQQYASEYLGGRIQALSDIYSAGLQPCHTDILAQFDVRANLIVPLLEGNRLWGLLCIHQCSAPRDWQPAEIEFVSQIAHHLSVALQQAQLLEQLKTQAAQQRALLTVVTRIRESLDLDTIFKATATEVRKLLNADRVGVFRFYVDSGYNDGEFVSEDVLPAFSSALKAKIHDHCFGENYSLHYAQGRIQATEDIYNASLKDCHVEVLARFQIRANLVVPLLQGERLWGLLCIHQCSGPRRWQPQDIEFVTQIATELSIAIQQAELLAQTRKQSLKLAKTLKDLQSAQTKLIQHEKMSSLGQLVAGVAHEINNPINFIHGNLSYANQYAQELLSMLMLYQRVYPEPVPEVSDRAHQIELDFLLDDFPRMLTSMQIGAERIRQIVLSLRNFSRLDEAEMKFVNIHEGIDSTLLILQYRLKARHDKSEIQITKDYGDLPLIECYPSQLNQVFMNLLSNAIDALEEEEEAPHLEPTHFSEPDAHLIKQITVRTALIENPQDHTPRAVICIADNGPGIPEPIQPKLFNPFFTTKPAGKGTGLGLSITYQIVVERHGGTLRCQSEPGRGTEFWIEIPIQQSKHEAASLA